MSTEQVNVPSENTFDGANVLSNKLNAPKINDIQIETQPYVEPSIGKNVLTRSVDNIGGLYQSINQQAQLTPDYLVQAMLQAVHSGTVYEATHTVEEISTVEYDVYTISHQDFTVRDYKRDPNSPSTNPRGTEYNMKIPTGRDGRTGIFHFHTSVANTRRAILRVQGEYMQERPTPHEDTDYTIETYTIQKEIVKNDGSSLDGLAEISDGFNTVFLKGANFELTATDRSLILQNTQDIATNTQDIATNTQDIIDNTAQIENNTPNLMFNSEFYDTRGNQNVVGTRSSVWNGDGSVIGWSSNAASLFYGSIFVEDGTRIARIRLDDNVTLATNCRRNIYFEEAKIISLRGKTVTISSLVRLGTNWNTTVSNGNLRCRLGYTTSQGLCGEVNSDLSKKANTPINTFLFNITTGNNPPRNEFIDLTATFVMPNNAFNLFLQYDGFVAGGDALVSNKLGDPAFPETFYFDVAQPQLTVSSEQLPYKPTGYVESLATSFIPKKKSILEWASNTTINYTAGTVEFDDGTGEAVSHSGTVDFATNGANGLDVGSLANDTQYDIYAITNLDTGISSAIGTLATSGSPSTPTLPAGYTKTAYINSVVTDGSGNIREFTQTGKITTLKGAVSVAFNTTQAPNSEVLRSVEEAVAPRGRNVKAFGKAKHYAGGVSSEGYLAIYSASMSMPTLPDFYGGSMATALNPAAIHGSQNWQAITNKFSQIKTNANYQNSIQVYIYVDGWEFID